MERDKVEVPAAREKFGHGTTGLRQQMLPNQLNEDDKGVIKCGAARQAEPSRNEGEVQGASMGWVSTVGTYPGKGEPGSRRRMAFFSFLKEVDRSRVGFCRILV